MYIDKFSNDNLYNKSLPYTNIDRKRHYRLETDTITVLYNYNKTATIRPKILVYNPSISISGCYNCKCCRPKARCCCCYNCYYTEFNVYNPNEFYLYNLMVSIGISSSLKYIKGTLKINNKCINDTTPIIINKLAPNEQIKISFLSYSPYTYKNPPKHIERITIKSCFLGFDNLPKCFIEKKYMIIK